MSTHNRTFIGGAAPIAISGQISTQISTQTSYQSMALPNLRTVSNTGLTRESFFNNMTPVWNGDKVKNDKLLALKYPDNTDIITLNRRDIIVEIVGMLKQQPFDEVLKFLQTVNSPEEIVWNQPSMNESKNAFAREIAITQKPETGIKTDTKCANCGAMEISLDIKQTRGGDEGATVFTRCINCGKSHRH